MLLITEIKKFGVIYLQNFYWNKFNYQIDFFLFIRGQGKFCESIGERVNTNKLTKFGLYHKLLICLTVQCIKCLVLYVDSYKAPNFVLLMINF